MRRYVLGSTSGVSTEEQALNPEGSIKNQEERLLQVVKLKAMEGQNIEVVKTYIDRAKSGKDTKRKELQKMLEDIRSQKLDLIMSSELSRISRNMKDFAEIWEMMKGNGCGFQSLRENFDTTTAAGEMVLYTIANIAQFERRQVSERVSANVNERSRRGLYNGGSVPLGYKLIEDKPGFLEVDEPQAQVVKEAFKAFLKEESLSKAAKYLNQNGFKMKKYSQGGGNKPRQGIFQVDNLHRLLTNICYIGKKRYKEAGVEKLAVAVWKPIIDEVTFERVQKKLKKNKSRKKPHSSIRYPYLLSGLTYCQACGDVMCGKSAHGSSGKVGYYEHSWATKKEACLTKKTFDCKPTRVPAKKLEPLVLEKIEELLTSRDFSMNLLGRVKALHKANPKGKEEKSLKAKIYGINSQLDAMAERLSELPASVSAAPIFKQMEVLESRKKEHEASLKVLDEEESVQEPASLKDYDRFRESLKKIFKGSDPKLKSQVIEKLVHKVEVGIDSVKVNYFVGQSHITRELGTKPDSLDFFVSVSSNSLTNGAPDRTRTPTVLLPKPIKSTFYKKVLSLISLLDTNSPFINHCFYRINNFFSDFRHCFVEFSTSTTIHRGFLSQKVFLDPAVNSKIELPCKVSSIRLKSPLKGLETKIQSSGEVVEFKALEPLSEANSYISRCGNRTFTNNLDSSDKFITIFRRVAMAEGKLPKKPRTAEELAIEGILQWQKEEAEKYN